MGNEKEQVLAAYREKLLGIRNYRHVTKQEFRADDFLDQKILFEFLEEVDTCESDITPAGKAFLASYYGLKELSATLAKDGGLTNTLETPEQIQAWLEKLEPMEITRFVEEARGTVTKNTPLRADLLPPENI